MRHRLPGSAGVPLRALIVALLLAGFGLWQGWTCTDGMMTSPMTGGTTPSTMITTLVTGVAHDASAAHADQAVQLASEEHPNPGIPAGLAGLCLSVLASLAVAVLLMGSPLRLLGLLRRLGESLLLPVQVAVRAPALTQICVSRT